MSESFSKVSILFGLSGRNSGASVADVSNPISVLKNNEIKSINILLPYLRLKNKTNTVYEQLMFVK